MNRIWVGTVDDIDNTHVELKAKKFGCSAPLIKADDQVRLKTLDIRTLIGPGIPVAVFAPQPQIRSRGRPRGCDFRWYEGLNFDLQEEDHTWTLRLTGHPRYTPRNPNEAAVAGSGP
jgi:hypothetical protein